MFEKSTRVLSLVLALGLTGMGWSGVSKAVGADGAAAGDRPLPKSANRKLLDAQTLEQLRRHEQFSAGWFKVEAAYEAASGGDKDRMVRQWMADALSDDFDKVTRAIAALGNVAAEEAIDVLMSIGEKPKQGNRPRWMAVRALGRIGDKKAVPLLINLLDHYNSDTRLYAKVALCEITGVFFGDSKQKWTEWADSQRIEVKQMDVGPKAGDNSQTRRPQRSRRRPPDSSNQTVSRSGSWPDGDCSISGRVYRKAGYSSIGHGKVCLSSEEFGSWIVEAQDNAQFAFSYIPPGTYTLRTLETFGYQDACYNPENKTVEKPTFQLREGERRRTDIEIEPLRPYHSIAGRIVDEDGRPIKNSEGLIVYAWWQKPQGRRKGQYERIAGSSMNEDGGYLLEELDARPVYVQVHDRDAPNKDNPYPPRFYPGTFSRADAKLVTAEDKEIIENVAIQLKRTGGLVLEGLVTDDSAGAPVPEALVSIFHHDMPFDLFCGYTDQQGRYRIEGLGEGTFIVHVDAVHKGLIKTRKTVTFKPDSEETHLDFALRRGVTISGTFVDQNGDPWKVGRGVGYGRVKRRDSEGEGPSNFVYGNRHAPSYLREGCTVFYGDGGGDALGVVMVFPAESSFMLPAMVPGETVIEFRPRREGERFLKILYQGRDISSTGLVTEPGQKTEDVTIVIGTSGSSGRSGGAQTGERLEFALHDAFGREVRSQDYQGVPIFLEFGACW